MNPVQINVGGLKCDNEACDFVDQSVSFKDYPKWINKPCPLCGNNLLTQEDYDTVNTIMYYARTINDNLIGTDVEEPLCRMSLNFDGTGKIRLNSFERLDPETDK